MKDGHPGVKGAKLSRHGVLDRTPREARELIAGPALVSLVDQAVGMDSGAHSKAIHDEFRIVRAIWGGDYGRNRNLGRIGGILGALREEFLNSGVVRTDAVGGQLICRHVVRCEAAIIGDRTILPLLARLICQHRTQDHPKNSAEARRRLTCDGWCPRAKEEYDDRGPWQGSHCRLGHCAHSCECGLSITLRVNRERVNKTSGFY